MRNYLLLMLLYTHIKYAICVLEKGNIVVEVMRVIFR